MTMNREELAVAVRAGRRFEYLFFWGHTPRADGEVDASCLSQWYPASFVVEGVRYLTAEHFMMAEKARLFGDLKKLAAILEAATPRDAKALGRKVSPFDQTLWNDRCVDVVVRGNVAKFGADERLRSFLLSTGEKVLVEASPRDTVWGIGLGRDNPKARDPSQWRGRNLLGFALMEARTRLRSKDLPSV